MAQFPPSSSLERVFWPGNLFQLLLGSFLALWVTYAVPHPHIWKYGPLGGLHAFGDVQIG